MVGQLSLNKIFEIDSAGIISYHCGDSADKRSSIIAKNHGIIMEHTARQIQAQDLDYFDYIMVMDHKNYRDILSLNLRDKSKLHYLREYDPEANGDLVIPDPYYGTIEDFELTYQQCYRSVNGFIQSLNR